MKEINSNPIYTIFIVSSAISAFMGFVLGSIISSDIKMVLFITISSGLTTGIIFSSLIHMALKISIQKPKTLNVNEADILVFGRANHQSNLIYRGGYLVLTKDELVFTPSKLNLQHEIYKIPIKDIKSIIKKNFYLIIPTGLYFELQNGEVEHFVINDRKAWLEELNKVIKV